MKLSLVFIACSVGYANAGTGILGGTGNYVDGEGAVVIGGQNNNAAADYAAIAGGNKNQVSLCKCQKKTF